MNKDYDYAIDVLSALKELMERISNREFLLDIYLSKNKSHHCFNFNNNFFEKNKEDPEVFSYICCKFIKKNIDDPLVTFKMGLSCCSLFFNIDPVVRSQFKEIAIYEKKTKTSSFNDCFDIFGLMIESIVKTR